MAKRVNQMSVAEQSELWVKLIDQKLKWRKKDEIFDKWFNRTPFLLIGLSLLWLISN